MDDLNWVTILDIYIYVYIVILITICIYKYNDSDVLSLRTHNSSVQNNN